MNLTDIILQNLDCAAVEYAQEEAVWTVNVRNFICRLQNFILDCVRDSIEEFSDAEKQIYSVFKRVTAKEQEELFKHEGAFKGLQISEKFKKMAYVIRQNAKQLGLSIDSQTASPPPPPPARRQAQKSAAPGKEAVVEKIKEIEILLNELKAIIL